MVQLKILITLYFTFTLRLTFILGQTSQDTVMFFSFPCCTRNTLVLEFISFAQSARTFSPLQPLLSQATQNTNIFWLQIIPRGTLSKSPSKSTSAATETQFSSATPRRWTDLYFPNQTPLPNNSDPRNTLFSSFLLQCNFFIIIKKESDYHSNIIPRMVLYHLPKNKQISVMELKQQQLDHH